MDSKDRKLYYILKAAKKLKDPIPERDFYSKFSNKMLPQDYDHLKHFLFGTYISITNRKVEGNYVKFVEFAPGGEDFYKTLNNEKRKECIMFWAIIIAALTGLAILGYTILPLC